MYLYRKHPLGIDCGSLVDPRQCVHTNSLDEAHPWARIYFVYSKERRLFGVYLYTPQCVLLSMQSRYEDLGALGNIEVSRGASPRPRSPPPFLVSQIFG